MTPSKRNQLTIEILSKLRQRGAPEKDLLDLAKEESEEPENALDDMFDVGGIVERNFPVKGKKRPKREEEE